MSLSVKVGINRASKVAGNDALGVQGRPSEDEPVGVVGLEEAKDRGVCGRNHITEGDKENHSSEDAHVGPTGSKSVILKPLGMPALLLDLGKALP